MPRIAPMVRTPVPPIPASARFQVPADHRQHRLGQARNVRSGTRIRGFGPPAAHGDEGGQKPFQSGIVLVAHGLVDAPLAAISVSSGSTGDAVGLDRAVAAAFADGRVDPQPQVRDPPSGRACGGGASRRRSLLVDDDGGAGDVAKVPHHRVDLVRGGERRLPGRGRPGSRGRADRTSGRCGRPARHGRDGVICWGVSTPSMGWPPVIATASLTRIL